MLEFNLCGESVQLAWPYVGCAIFLKGEGWGAGVNNEKLWQGENESRETACCPSVHYAWRRLEMRTKFWSETQEQRFVSAHGRRLGRP